MEHLIDTLTSVVLLMMLLLCTILMGVLVLGLGALLWRFINA